MTNIDKTMNENDKEVVASENDTEKTENTEGEGEEKKSEEPKEDVEELKKKLATAEAQKEHWKKKASEKKEAATDSLSQSDLLALAKADIHEDDIDEVMEFAKFKKISVKDALKNDTLQVVIKDREEKRKSAAVANAKPGRPAQQKVTDEAVLADAFNNDKIPAKGSEEAERLFWAKRGGKPR